MICGRCVLKDELHEATVPSQSVRHGSSETGELQSCELSMSYSTVCLLLWPKLISVLCFIKPCADVKIKKTFAGNVAGLDKVVSQ